MPRIDQIAYSQGIDWRTLQRMAPLMQGDVADALTTRGRFRTPEQRSLLAAAQDIGAEDPAAKELREKRERRARGVNQLGVGRVNGRTLEHGQPRQSVQPARRRSR